MNITQEAIEIAQRWPVTAEEVQSILDAANGDIARCEALLAVGAAGGYQERYSLAHGRQANGVDLALELARLARNEQD